MLLVLSCNNVEINEAKIYSMEDFTGIGVKMKGDFETEFPEATDAKWGFFKGREVAVLRYPTIDLAKINGLTAGSEQTEKIEITKKNIAHGYKVERTICRGHKPGVGVSGRGGLKLSPGFNSINGLNGTLIINKVNLFSEDLHSYPKAPVCPRREPLYTESVIRGNLVILGEPLSGEDSEGTIKFLEELADKLP